MPGDQVADKINALLVQIAPDYVPIPGGDPTAQGIRVIAEKLANAPGITPNGDPMAIAYDQLVAATAPGYVSPLGEGLGGALDVLLNKYIAATAFWSDPFWTRANFWGD